MLVPFNTIWEVSNGEVTNKVTIRVGGITAYPRALEGYRGSFGGIIWKEFIGHDLDVKTDGDTMVIKGIF